MFIACTGHRPHKLNNEYDGNGPVSSMIRMEMAKVIEKYNPERILTGMALGVDMLWAEAGISAGITVVACIPCKGQDSRWPDTSRARYRSILMDPHVTQVLVSEEPYSAALMQERNRWMVDHSQMLLAVWDRSRGGTANCVEYAMSKDRPIVYIDVRKIRAMALR
jgi:uncharacterized phage-like protein YoqJ